MTRLLAVVVEACEALALVAPAMVLRRHVLASLRSSSIPGAVGVVVGGGG